MVKAQTVVLTLAAALFASRPPARAAASNVAEGIDARATLAGLRAQPATDVPAIGATKAAGAASAAPSAPPPNEEKLQHFDQLVRLHYPEMMCPYRKVTFDHEAYSPSGTGGVWSITDTECGRMANSPDIRLHFNPADGVVRVEHLWRHCVQERRGGFWHETTKPSKLVSYSETLRTDKPFQEAATWALDELSKDDMQTEPAEFKPFYDPEL